MRCLRYTSRGMISPAIPTQTDRSGCWIIIGNYGATFKPWVMLVTCPRSSLNMSARGVGESG